MCPACGECGHGYCGQCCSRHGNYFLRWILGIVILLLVFWLGVTVGRFSGLVKYGNFDGYGYGSHRMMYFNAPAANNSLPTAPIQ